MASLSLNGHKALFRLSKAFQRIKNVLKPVKIDTS